MIGLWIKVKLDISGNEIDNWKQETSFIIIRRIPNGTPKITKVTHLIIVVLLNTSKLTPEKEFADTFKHLPVREFLFYKLDLTILSSITVNAVIIISTVLIFFLRYATVLRF